jgi:hypothetical protein
VVAQVLNTVQNVLFTAVCQLAATIFLASVGPQRGQLPATLPLKAVCQLPVTLLFEAICQLAATLLLTSVCQLAAPLLFTVVCQLAAAFRTA